ncbi:MAG: carboxypeptidase-like regulatory domain-containing protein, partial [Rubrivivax sp.]
MSASLFHMFSRTAVSAAAAVVLAAPAFAQNTTAALSGQVTGSDGKPLAGATVSILHVESRSVSTATTGADGRFGARGLRVGGPYTVTVTRGGATDRRDNVFLTLAETTNLDVQLGTVTTVVVTGSAVSDKF